MNGVSSMSPKANNSSRAITKSTTSKKTGVKGQMTTSLLPTTSTTSEGARKTEGTDWIDGKNITSSGGCRGVEVGSRVVGGLMGFVFAFVLVL